MKIVVVGDGKVGQAITAQLSREEHDVVVIDSNPNVLQQSEQSHDVLVIRGNGASLSCLREAGAASADLLIAATSADEVNLLSCIMARHLGVSHAIARVRNPEYTEQLVVMQDMLGLSMTINPELLAAKEAYNLLQFPSFLQRDTFAKGRVEIVEIKIEAGSKLIDIPLHRLQAAVGVKVLVCAVERREKSFIPAGDFILREGDHIHVTAAGRDLAALMRSLGLQTHKVRSVLIIGGSRIAFYLAERLLAGGVAVKIIEKKHSACVALSEKLPGAVIIEGDGSSKELLLEEGLEETDALVTLTDIDEENIFVSLYGLHIGVPKVITKINKTEFSDVIEGIGIDSFISPKLLCSTDIVRYVRAMAGAKGGEVVAMHELVSDEVDALEFRATEKTRHLGVPLAEMPLKKEFLIACIIHRNRVIIPKGDSVLHKNDTVVVVTHDHQAITDLNEIFE